jgi:hypothetical protein
MAVADPSSQEAIDSVGKEVDDFVKAAQAKHPEAK